jgi:TctA family transporter
MPEILGTSIGLIGLALLLGTVGGVLAGLTPGINGRAGLLLATPFAIGLGPVAGATFLVAFHAVVHSTGAIPAILLGAPTSATEAATVIDGYALTQRGEAGRAIGAALGASAAGGVIGALFLMALAPAALAVTRQIGAPEIAALSLVGLLSIAALSGSGVAGGLAGGILSTATGIILGLVGLDNFSGISRFSFGLIELHEGLSPAAIVTGLFVIPELIRTRSAKDATHVEANIDPGAVRAGFREALSRRWLLLRTSIIGAAVGLAPGLGASVAVWVAYGHARQTESPEVPFGQGALAGVIAPEAANNAKEGGALGPTLLFGIPSSSGMGILLAAFALIGLEVGPRMAGGQPSFVYLMAVTIIIANLLAVAISLPVLPVIGRIATLRKDAVSIFALTAAIAVTWMTDPSPVMLLVLGAMTLLGLAMKAADIPRAPLLLGFVLAPMLESGLFRSVAVYGSAAFSRPGVLLIFGIGAMIAVPALARWHRRTSTAPTERAAILPLVVALFAALIMGSLIALCYHPMSTRLLPGLAGIAGLCASLQLFWRIAGTAPGGADTAPSSPDSFQLAGLVCFVVAIPVIGVASAAGLFVISLLVRLDGWRTKTILAGALMAIATAGLTLLRPAL